jgi:hypothetical protein
MEHIIGWESSHGALKITVVARDNQVVLDVNLKQSLSRADLIDLGKWLIAHESEIR